MTAQPSPSPSAPNYSAPSTLNALNKLRDLTGKQWDHLEHAAKAAKECRAKVKGIVESENLISSDTAMVVFGSIARDEFTSGSDCDWTLLVDGMTIGDHHDCAAKIRKALSSARIPGPGPTGVFGSLVHSHELVHQIGGDEDSNRNTTRRILLLLESAAIGEPSSALVRNRVIGQIIKRYLEQEPSMTQEDGKRRVPRFLLNDVVRYWRTMAVDYARKVRDRDSDGWALRNIKLRLSRKLTFVSGMLTCFDCVLRPACSALESDLFNDKETQLLSVQEHVHAYVEATPVEILARAVYCYSPDEKSKKDLAVQVFDSYDAFLGLMDNTDHRKELKTLPLRDADSNGLYKNARELGYEFQRGLTKLFFHTDKELTETTQEYGVF